MTDPYNSPQSETDSIRPLSAGMLILSIILTVMSVLIYAAIIKIVPEFAQLSIGFGAELPGLTKILINTYMYYGFLALLGLVPCLVLIFSRKKPPKNKTALLMLVVINGVLAVMIMGLVIVSMYLPISMETVVGPP